MNKEQSGGTFCKKAGCSYFNMHKFTDATRGSCQKTLIIFTTCL